MAISSTTGLATGIDTEGLVTKLMDVERQPVTLLQRRQQALTTKKTAFSALAVKLTELSRQAATFADPGKFFPRSVIASDDSVAVASAAPGAGRGTYSLTVTGLARGSIATSSVTTSATTNTIATGAGAFTFRLGATGADVTIPVTATTTLEGLVVAVNNANAGVRAAIVNVGTAAVPAFALTLTSNATGSANDIQVRTDGTTLAIASSQSADDAHFSIAGLGSFTRATNSFSDVIDGVTLTLKSGSGTTDLTVDYSAGALQSSVQSLINAYNDVLTTVASQSAGTADANGKITPGILSGESAPRFIVSALRRVVTTRLAGAFGTLSDVGISVTRTGTLQLDPAKFQAALSTNPAAVSTLVAGTTGQSGIADLLTSVVDAATGAVDGSLTVRQQGLDASIKDMQRQIDAALDRLTVRERTLRAQYAALEDTIGRLQQTQSALSSQLASLANLSTYISSGR
jgi:flagellar hook-associated protein 2